MTVQTHLTYEFDDFQLEPDDRRLVRYGKVIPLHGKAFEMLLVLIRNRGRLLTKDELFALVWPDQIVEESNLTVNMSTIRRALGERASHPRYITTVSGRGYRFTADVHQFDESLTVERETFARVTVEQEETESPLVSFAAQIARAVERLNSPLLILLITCSAVLAIAGLSVWTRTLNHTSAAPLPWARVAISRFATQGGVPFRVAISPDGKSVVYRQRIGDKESLWLGQIESNSSVLIAEQSDRSYNGLTFSPDGQSVYLTEGLFADSATKLVRMPIVGGIMSELLSHVDSAVTFSPDGKQLAFLRRDGEETSIIIADSRDGKNERTLVTRKRPETFSSSGLSWSPDGLSIAVAANKANDRRSEILAVAVADGDIRKISGQDWGAVGNLAWQADGSGLLLTARNSQTARRSEIWFVPYPAGEPRKITNDLNQYLIDTLSLSSNGILAVLQGHMESEIWQAPDGDPQRTRLVLQGIAPRYEGVDGLTWTPEGHLLYSAYVGDAIAIWEMNSDGSNRRQLTSGNSDSIDRQINVTRDNRYIVFQSNRSGRFEIWRANRDGSAPKQLTQNNGNNSQPSVSPDSKWILYVSDRLGTSTLWRMSIDGEHSTQLTLNFSTGPQVSPDGKQIAYLESSHSVPLHIAIIPFTGGEPEKVFPLPQRPPTNLAKQMRWTPDGTALIYKDSIQGLWRQRLDEKGPQPIKGFEDVQVHQLGWSFDGSGLAYTRGANMQEIILLQNLK
ncbi:MAG TPA: winged helix-turn-helix domain-containing protein [Pyrinomonadaceae bacterium]|nr:winged helix-turn-helix domain-containing protein [Pyrinomonadaceae bacterium]